MYIRALTLILAEKNLTFEFNYRWIGLNVTSVYAILQP